MLALVAASVLPTALGFTLPLSSSDTLRLAPMGAQIDRHHTIWRLNNAPVKVHDQMDPTMPRDNANSWSFARRNDNAGKWEGIPPNK